MDQLPGVTRDEQHRERFHVQILPAHYQLHLKLLTALRFHLQTQVLPCTVPDGTLLAHFSRQLVNPSVGDVVGLCCYCTLKIGRNLNPKCDKLPTHTGALCQPLSAVNKPVELGARAGTWRAWGVGWKPAGSPHPCDLPLSFLQPLRWMEGTL